MKNQITLRLKLRLALVMLLIFGVKIRAQNEFQDRVPIEQTQYGINAWFFSASNVSAFWPLLRAAKAAGVRVMRLGGIEFCYRPIHGITASPIVPVNMVTSNEVIILRQVIDSIRANGMEPIIQVGFNPVCSNITPLGPLPVDTQAVIAGRLVRTLKGLVSPPCSLYSVANEPDLPNNACDINDPGGFTYNTVGDANTIGQYYRKFATAMKTEDPSITIFGPELATFGKDSNYAVNKLTHRLCSNPSSNPVASIMGTIPSGPAAGKFFCDVLSIHYYLTSASSMADVKNSATTYREKISSTGGTDRGLLQLVPSNRNIGNLKFAVTEINIDLDNGRHEDATAMSYDSLMAGFDNRGFAGAQWLCDIYRNTFALSDSMPGQPRQAWVKYLNVWSIKEGDCKDGLGLLSSCSSHENRKRPMFTAYQMLTEHFKGTYYRGFTNNSDVKTFASVESHGWKIMVINYGNSPHDFRVNVDGSNSTSGSHPLNLDFHLNYDPLLNGNATFAPAYNSVISGTPNPLPANSIVILTFHCDGSMIHRLDYTLDDAKALIGAKITQIGQNVVNSDMILCNLPGGIGGTISSSTSYVNTTVPITSDITLDPGVTLSFDNCLVVMNPETKITGGRGNQIHFNKCIVVGCEGTQWEGVELTGLAGGESLTSDSTVLINANYPFYADNVPTVSITKNFIANGHTAVTLKGNHSGFRIDENYIGAFEIGIKTENSVDATGSSASSIDNNIISDIDYPMYFLDSDHSQLSVSCNNLAFRQIGIFSQACTLPDFGSSSVGAGNLWKKTLWDDPSDYIEHTGNSPTYYYGPSEAAMFPYPGVMNITSTPATGDNDCQLLLVLPCDAFPVGVEKNKITTSHFNIFPNPSTGQFSLEGINLQGKYSLMVSDILGRTILNKQIDFSDKTISFGIPQKGIYIVALFNNETRLTRKVIVE